MHVQVHAMQHGHVQATFLETLGQAACAQHHLAVARIFFVVVMVVIAQITHSAAPRQGSHGWRASLDTGWPQRPGSAR
ncbi:hypothetical protein SDC9_65146 [bioreactor metagenome]|uniref:Uncharacterized protein n=1 Tax=bioreactor metagenome TaxID=1076179 RepID=A0A644XWR7_9ZZZZ